MRQAMERVAIVGLGLIGGSLAKAFSARTGAQVAGFDRDPAVVQAALDCSAIAKAGEEADLAQADLVYLCLYPQGDLDFARQHATSFGSHCVVTDVCGIKGQLCRQLAALAAQHGFAYCGGHPMAGTTRHGFAASRTDLFDGASYILVPCGAPAWAMARVQQAAMALGCGGTCVADPQTHDQMIAFTSQLPHALACAYVLSPRCPHHQGFSAGSYKDVSRVANINENLWTELFLDNRGPLTKELDTLLENLTAIRDAVAQKDAEKLKDLLRRGRLVKEELGE